MFGIDNVGELVKVMQAAIAPVTVISGLAFLLSLMANRFGRCIDRTRQLLKELDVSQPVGAAKDRLHDQIQMIYLRARLIRTSMVLASVSVLFIVLHIGSTFAALVAGWPIHGIAALCFGVALLLLLASLGLFIRELVVSLRALKLEILAHPRADFDENSKTL